MPKDFEIMDPLDEVDKEEIIGLFYVKTDEVSNDLLRLISHLKVNKSYPLHDISDDIENYQQTVKAVPCIITRKNRTVYRLYGDHAFIHVVRHYLNREKSKGDDSWINGTTDKLLGIYSKMKCRRCVSNHLSLKIIKHDCDVKKVTYI